MKRTQPDQPLQRDEDGSLRFRPNEVVRALLDGATERGFDLNALAARCCAVDRQEWVQFAQLIGYSQSGWGDLSYVTDEDWNRVDRKPKPRKRGAAAK